MCGRYDPQLVVVLDEEITNSITWSIADESMLNELLGDRSKSLGMCLKNVLYVCFQHRARKAAVLTCIKPTEREAHRGCP